MPLSTKWTSRLLGKNTDSKTKPFKVQDEPGTSVPENKKAHTKNEEKKDAEASLKGVR